MPSYSEDSPIRLNKLISMLGYCSRRKADELIQNGSVKVDGIIVKELGFKAYSSSKIEVEGNLLSKCKYVYILLNKPKNTITTLHDPEGRKTILDIVQIKDRVYPIGRLDRNSTGTLLLTNDGNLSNLLTHPSSNITKTYYVELDQEISKSQRNQLLQGIKLEDGVSKFDSLTVKNKGYVVKLHSGKNRIIRRMFNSIDLNVKLLHRTEFANISISTLESGKWRHLTPIEVDKLYNLVKK